MATLSERLLDGDSGASAATAWPASEKGGTRKDVPQFAIEAADIVAEEEGPRMGWPAAACILTANLVGIGILAVPSAFAALGSTAAVVVLIGFAAACTYSGCVISRLSLHVAAQVGRRPRKYYELAAFAFGERSGRVARRIQMLFLTLAMTAWQHVAASTMQQLIESGGASVCPYSTEIIVLLIMLPLVQFQTLSRLSLLAAFGIAMIVLAVGIYLGQIAVNAPSDVPAPTFDATDGNSFDAIVQATMTIAFAYLGWGISPEVNSELRTPTEMPKAVFATGTTMLLMYTFVGAFTYHYLGDDATFLEDWSSTHLKHAASSVAGNVCLFLHLLPAYTISFNIVAQAATEAIAGPPVLYRPDGGALGHPKILWLKVSLGVLAMVFTLSNVIPSLGLFLPFIAATTGNCLTFLIPISCLLKIGVLSPQAQRGHWVLLGIYSIVTGVATVATLIDIANGIADSAAPFSC